jgi:ATP-dependent DNA ligase
MQLPVMPPVSPMLAKAIASMDKLPAGEYVFEPKWDGFRCIVFRDGDEVELASRNERSLTRYFPELVPALLASLPARCVLDGEIVVSRDGRLEFDVLSQRIHPAASRINRLAQETPASFVAFDLLALGDLDLRALPFAERRRALLDIGEHFEPPVHLTPSTTDRATAADWFSRFEGAGFDGVVAKPSGQPYTPDKRTLFKIKHERTADCAVAGFRWHVDGKGIGSLLLGLYDDEGTLQHIGVATSFTAARRIELIEELIPYRLEDLASHPWADWASQMPPASGPADPAHEASGGVRMPGAPNRWNGQKDQSWVPLRMGLVIEVAYEGMLNGRLRHGARLRRFRPDREPRSCTFTQLDTPVPQEIAEIFGS